MEHLIFSKKELEKMLEFANDTNDNVVLFWEHNCIGTEYAIQTQSDLQTGKTDLKFITNWENW